jgi:hypothetical protein
MNLAKFGCVYAKSSTHDWPLSAAVRPVLYAYVKIVYMTEHEEHPGDTQDDSQAEVMRNLAQPEAPTEVLLPAEGGIYEKNGTKYRFVRQPTGTQLWNDETQQLEPRYHTLKTWFSHSTPGVTSGAGWDGRWGLLDLAPEEMLQRYGHTFTPAEVSAPAGRRKINDEYEETIVGGMPDDIPYYGLEKIDEDPDSPDRHAQL